MADVFIGTMLLVPYKFAPYGWAFCQGQLLPVQQYTPLFALIGNRYGGDGIRNFALPNLPGRLVVGSGISPGMDEYQLGVSGGSPTTTLSSNTVPQHAHVVAAASVPRKLDQSSPANNSFYDTGTGVNLYSNSSANLVNLTAGPGPNGAVASQGGGQAHNNMMPYLSLNWIIALTGLFPPRD
ncbi:MAG: phage tail protein [Bryobacteraceae bacterium]